MKSERGSMAINIAAIILIITMGALAYVLWHKSPTRTDNGRDYSDAIGASYNAPGATRNDYAARRPNTDAVFSDGLPQIADDAIKFTLDEFGEGIASTDVFFRDINNDGAPDRITRTRVENGTDHYSEQYKIELRIGDEFIDITPSDFQTTEAADCSLQKIQFDFGDVFRVIKIARPWRDTWRTPTMAVRTVYTFSGDKLIPGAPVRVGTVCDVAELF